MLLPEEMACTGLDMASRIVLFVVKQLVGCTMFGAVFKAAWRPTNDSSTLPTAAAAAGGAFVQQQKQQAYFLLPSLLLLYWLAYRPAKVASYAQADCLVPITVAQQAASAAKVLAQQQGQWVLPLEWRQAAVLELPPLFNLIGQCLLQPATTPTAGSSSGSKQVSRFCAEPASAALIVARCMGTVYAAISGSIDKPISSNGSVGLGPQHAGAAHQLLEFAVRSKTLQFLRHMPGDLRMLLRPGSVWMKAAAAAAAAGGPTAGLSGSGSSSSGGGDSSTANLTCLSLCVSLLKAMSLNLRAESAASIGGGYYLGAVGGNTASTVCQQMQALLLFAVTEMMAAHVSLGETKPDGSWAVAGITAAAAEAAVPWLVLFGRVLQQAEVGSQEVLIFRPAVRAFLGAAGAGAHLTPAGLDLSETLQLQDGVSEATGSQAAAWRSLGVSLTSLAFPYACNNPTCSNLAGPQELQLVNGRSCVCGGCRVAHYCSRTCQWQHWKAHKPVWQAIAAAQAAKTGTTAAAVEQQHRQAAKAGAAAAATVCCTGSSSFGSHCCC
jgi:hypothetical protein